jgi:8-oxo-dGTP pyrophosphatase MutT (NUDIX family)
MRPQSASPTDKKVRAAGGVVLRPGRDGLEVVVIHRPEQQDWSFPKGKLEGSETDEQCALREVEEETGYRCEIGVMLGSSCYKDARGREKVVRYFVMRAASGEFAPNAEVDELSWLPLAAASELLSYRRDKEMLLQLGDAAWR